MIRMAWHGGASFSLELEGLEILVDPSFSRPGDYPPWFNEGCVNRNSPTVETFLELYRPEYLFLTHGHFDHFDLVTVKKLAAALDVLIVGTPEVLRTCREILRLPVQRLVPCPPSPVPVTGGPAEAHHPGSDWLILRDSAIAGEDGGPAVRARAVPGPHWFTGEKADAVAARFAARPDRYGALPCGGPMFGFLFRVGERTVYVSGDTEAPGLPTGPFDAAVVSCGGELMNPATREREGPFLDEPALARAASEVLKTGVLVPIHYDHPVFLTRFSPARLRAELERYPGRPELILPPYGTWSPLLP